MDVHTKTSNTAPFRLHRNGWGRTLPADLKLSSTEDPAKFTAILQKNKGKKKNKSQNQCARNEWIVGYHCLLLYPNKYLNMSVNRTHFWSKVTGTESSLQIFVTSHNVSIENVLRDTFAYLSDTCTAADMSCWDSAWTNILATNSTTCSVWNMKSPFRWFLSCLSCGKIKDKFTTIRYRKI